MSRTLRQGQRGPDVRRWQQFLVSQGAAPGPNDGFFGEQTALATRTFQEARGVKADAIVGPKTLTEAARLGLNMLRRLGNNELSSALIAQARGILAAHFTDPFGTEVPFKIDAIQYVGRIEEHYHAPGGPRKPWGYHVGVSLFVDSRPDTTIVAPDDLTEPAGVHDAERSEAPPVVTRGVIVLDPGHGGTVRVGASSPNNARSPSGVLEKQLTLRMAELVRDSIGARANGVRVELTRTSDVNLDLSERARVARDSKADLFLSLHFNGFNADARGVEVLIRPKASGNVNHAQDRALAERVLGATHQALLAFDPTTPNRGVKEQELGVLRDDLLGNSAAQAACRACLLELEFLDTQKVDALFNTGPSAEQVRRRVAEAIADALLAELVPANA